MHERQSLAVSGFVDVDTDLEREFEARLAETSTLAFRVAYSVLRHREDAEDVAQEAFAKAYHRFRQLRHRNAFRAWLVRMTCASRWIGGDRIGGAPRAKPPISINRHRQQQPNRKLRLVTAPRSYGRQSTHCPKNSASSSSSPASRDMTCETWHAC